MQLTIRGILTVAKERADVTRTMLAHQGEPRGLAGSYRVTLADGSDRHLTRRQCIVHS
jgi:hypothetical protein